VGKKRGVGRQRKNRIPSCLERTGKVKRQVKCIGCGEKGHRQDNWRRGLTGTKKIKRTKKNAAKPGRKKKSAAKKKSKTVSDEEVQFVGASPRTPRTRAAAAAREAAEAARQVAQPKACEVAQPEPSEAAQPEASEAPPATSTSTKR
jgi:hypothetical protein